MSTTKEPGDGQSTSNTFATERVVAEISDDSVGGPLVSMSIEQYAEQNNGSQARASDQEGLIIILLESTRDIENEVLERSAEIQNGFDGLRGDLSQIQSRIDEWRKYISESNSAVLASIKRARKMSKGFVASDEFEQLFNLYEKEEGGKGFVEKLSFT